MDADINALYEYLKSASPNIKSKNGQVTFEACSDHAIKCLLVSRHIALELLLKVSSDLSAMLSEKGIF